MLVRRVVFSSLLLASGCATRSAPAPAEGRAGSAEDLPWSAPPLERAIAVLDGRTGEPVSFASMLDSLAAADAVFLGETHLDETTHRVELAVYEGLLERREGRVVLALEMFERDVQPVLDDYLAGEIDEAAFLEKARPWNNYRTAYRPLIERARAGGHPVVASNIPRPLARRIGQEGLSVLEELDGGERRQAPAEVLPNAPGYWRRVDNAVRGHLQRMQQSGGDDLRLTSTQTLWDNTMGESCALALDAHPGALVLHVNGGFHSAYWSGTVQQFQRRRPGARVLTVDVRPVTNPSVITLDGAPVADYVVLAEDRASDRNEGTWSVSLSRALEYRLHVPEDADEESPAPLLIWLGEDELTSEDGLDLWRARLGDSAAIAVLEPPYRAQLEDLSEGGRWFWPESFDGDLSSLVGATERVWAYLLRHFPVDPDQVCIAGEGTGATVVAALALLGDRASFEAVALHPRRYAKLKDFPLPLPELRGDGRVPEVSLKVLGAAADEAWWQEELAAYAGIGLGGTFEAGSEDPWQRDRQQEDLVRGALGLGESAPLQGPRAFVRVSIDSARARHWSRLHALRYGAATGRPVAVVDAGFEADAAEEIAIPVHPASLEGALPRCPGPFGGTTVLVLPEDVNPADAQAWKALEQNDPLARESRFHRLRVASVTGAPALPEVLAKLEEEGRKNVLIVPAVFCAEGPFLRGLERQVRACSDRMTLHWLPGLGGQDIPVAAGGEPASAGTVVHELVVELDPGQQRLAVQDTLALPPSLRGAGVEFTLNDALHVRSSEPAVEKVGADEDGNARYALLADAADGLLHLAYDGIFDFGLSDQKEEYSRGFRETRGIVGPEGVYLDGDSGWTARFGEEMVRFEVDVRAPEGWHVVSQGTGTSRDGDGTARWDSAADLEQVYLVGGPLVLFRDTAGAVDVQVYLHEPDEALARKYLDTAAQYLEMYREMLGPYPYTKFALVENFWETGYGMPSFTLLGPEVIRLPFILHSSYPHEILHNWWGNSVFVDYDSGNWCEGLTAYLADHLVQEQRGLGADYRLGVLQKYRSYVKEGRDFPLSGFHSRHSAATEAVGYGKALMLFHMLRRDLGDEAFGAALAGFYRKHRGTRASFDDIREACESVTGRDLGPFFDQWVARPGAPDLRVADVRVTESGGGFRVAGVLEQVQEDAPFVLSVPVQVVTGSGAQTVVVEMSERTAAFEVGVDARPGLLAVDPMFDVFRQLDARETPPSIGQIFGEPEILAVLPSSSASLSQYRDLMTGWETEDHRIEQVQDADLEELPSDRAVWILGRDNRFARDLLAFAVEPGGGAITLGADQVPLDQHSLVVIRRHPANPEKAVGWISVEPVAAFPGMGRKLPHYGKYSYLAFEGDEPGNFVKGQWGVVDSPLVIDLRQDESQPLPAVVAEARPALAELPPVFSTRALLEHVAWLAAPERGGRGLGTEGLDASAKYIAEQFAAAGLEPGGDGGTWFQRFEVPEGPDGSPVEAVNVVGVLPGSRGDWADQSIVLGAHYDHLGRGWPDVHAGDEGQVHCGADDNASGVAVMIELARVLASKGGASRNLVLVAFSAEECGLVGSRYFVEHPAFPLRGIRGMINLDTVGRLEDKPLAVHATGTADEWQHIFRGVGFVTGIQSKNVAERVGGSDQDSFIDRGIPAVQVFSGAHLDYHRPGDTTDKVDAPGLVKVAVFVKEALDYLLEREEPLTVTIEGHAGDAPAAGTGAARKVSFGTVPSYEFQGEGVLIESLVPGSPAEVAGLQPGDVLVQLDQTPIADLGAFSTSLKTLEPGQTVIATVSRGGQRLEFPVTVVAR